MATNRGSGPTSRFDEMLEENRRQLEDLYRGTGAGSAPEPAPPKDAPATPSLASAPGSEASPPAPHAPAAPSDSVRFLNDRYGDGWRYEITERRREGDEVIVLCKLIIGDHNITKSHFGRARVGRPGAHREIRGSADGITFALRSENGVRAASGVDAEEAAFREAVDSALARCASML